MNNHFGEHLTIDGYGGDYEKLNNKDLVLMVLNDLPDLVSMTKLSKPEVYFAEGNGNKDLGGWSGFVVIEESHISIHTFPANGFISADVYTCRNNMDISTIVDFFKKTFDLKDIEQNFLKRGLRYTQNVETIDGEPEHVVQTVSI
jgi:S-adenosylmethionine decarboxylase